ncbi:right-handed parallel beta-helix repeat-containing protein [Clostridium estertheticum]|uniref:right-handed parallel beta-helix repeat-containing protein n=1 Tax=Clostridium estertheticum TaxID=238834 RepID=UPI001C7DEE76|nr:right-handed parallel beta-helix repeat-containing protein [Clostridium estertheticum]MBX4258642.1 right-handed parallel beta-helix repeat-containing protein [Clostridium estertheticum]WLC69886.1 right-handed parallel beta-helix repeat-containing protein [Clostridium estertheticum]
MKFFKNKTVIIIIVVFFAFLIGTFVVINKTKDLSLHNINNNDIKKYSLDITGATDTTAAFQKMINSYPSGSTIKLPEGKYSLHGSVKLPDGIKLLSKNKAVFIGTGKNTLFFAGNDNSFQGIGFQNCSTAINIDLKKGLNVTECKFTNKIDYVALNISASSNCIITSCYFKDIRKYGIKIDNDSSNITVDKNNFDNDKVFGGYQKEQISGHIYCLNGNKISVTNNVLKNSGGQGVIFGFNSTTGKGTTNSVASGNTCIGNGQEGLTIYGGDKKVTSGNSLIGNISKNNRFNQIEVWQTKDNIVKNNTVEESIKGVGNLGAICLYETSNTTATGNKVLSAQKNGIDITAGSSNNIVSNNIINNTNGENDNKAPEKGNGILLDSNGKNQPHHITIKDNKISSSNEIISKSGIYSTSNTDQHNTIDNNTIKGYKIGLHEYAKMTIGK